MKKALIFGTNSLSQLIYRNIEETQGCPKVVGFVVDQDHYTQQTFSDLPVHAMETLTEKFPPEEFGIYVCVGYNKMNALRRKIYKTVHQHQYSILSYIHPSASMGAKKMGEGTIAMQNVVVDAECVVGDGNIFLANSMLAHHSKLGDFNFLSLFSCIAGGASVDDECFFGVHSTVRDGVSVGAQTLVGAGAYLAHDSAPASVIVPARSIVLESKNSLECNL